MVEITEDTQNDFTTFKCSGDLIEQELLDVIRSFYKGSPTKYTLWYLDGLSAESISTDALKRIFQIIRSRGDPRKDGRTAIVAPLDLE